MLRAHWLMMISIYYNDAIMSAMASQIASLTIVYSTVYSRRRPKKTSKLPVTGLCGGIHRWPVNSPQKASNTENVSIWWRHHVLYYVCNSPDTGGWWNLQMSPWHMIEHPDSCPQNGLQGNLYHCMETWPFHSQNEARCAKDHAEK